MSTPDRSPPPAPAARGAEPASAGQLLQLVRSGQARTRRDLALLTGLSRGTVAQRVEALVGAGMLRESGLEVSTGGRPPSMLSFDNRDKVVAAADLGVTHGRVALAEPSGLVLGEAPVEMRMDAGPDKVVRGVRDALWGLLKAAGRSVDEVRGVGVGVPGPIDVAGGRVLRAPVMPGWHDYPLADALAAELGAPVYVDNDANLMAYGEHRITFPQAQSLLFVKVGTGIGAGLVVAGSIYHGVDGAEGNIGHIRLSTDADAPPCTCGATGCLAASASGAALARQLRALGLPARGSRDVGRLVQAGDPQAVALTREAGRLLGEVLVMVVSLLNPQVLVLGGDVALTSEYFEMAVREALYQRSQPLATRNLTVATSALGERAGIVGATSMVTEQVFSAAAVDLLVASQAVERAMATVS